MNLMAAKLLSRHGSKMLRASKYDMFRMSSCSNKDSNPPAKDSKPEACLPQDKEKDKKESELPPCATSLPCAARTTCVCQPDPNNPCNYCPPDCIDPDAPDLVKLKRNQCKFQEDNDIPIFLKGGKFDIFWYQTTLILTLISLGLACYNLYKMANKN